MSTDPNKAVIRALYRDVFDQGNLAAADELVEAAAVDHGPDLYPGQAPAGPDRLKQQATWFRTAFPDATWTIDDLLAERDKVVVRATFRGTHDGEFLGMPPTHRPVKMMDLKAYRVVGGKIAEIWGRAETFGLRTQLGDAPTLGPRTPTSDPTRGEVSPTS